MDAPYLWPPARRSSLLESLASPPRDAASSFFLFCLQVAELLLMCGVVDAELLQQLLVLLVSSLVILRRLRLRVRLEYIGDAIGRVMEHAFDGNLEKLLP